MCEIILNAYFGALAFVHVFPLFSATGSPFIDYRLLGCPAPACWLFSRVSIRKSTHQRTNDDDDDDDGDSVLRNISKNTSVEDTPEEIVLDKHDRATFLTSFFFKPNRSRDLFYSRTALYYSTAILARPVFPAASELTPWSNVVSRETLDGDYLSTMGRKHFLV